MNRRIIVASAGLAAAAALVWSNPSRADDVVVAQPAPAPAPAQSTTVVATGGAGETPAYYQGPDRRLISSGLITFGLSYIPAVVVAGTSDTSADHHLYVPVIGPWLDLGDRPGCGSGHIGCDTETTYKVLLVLDGIFQDLGILTAASGLLMPEHHVAVVSEADKKQAAIDANKPTVHVSPSEVANGAYGVAAFGSF
jgi:hypothetical protein